MTTQPPYFMLNKEWFFFDEAEFCYKLTDKAPEDAKTSYREFYDLVSAGR